MRGVVPGSKIKALKLIISFSFCFLWACSQYHPMESNKHLRSEEFRIMESVFRYLIGANTDQSKPVVYCLSLGDRYDPPPELLSRFRDLPNVKNYSDCEFSPQREGVSDPIGFATDRETGKSAFILTIDAVEWRNSKDIRVKAGYFRNSLVAAKAFYYLSRKGDEWVIRKEKLIAIS